MAGYNYYGGTFGNPYIPTGYYQPGYTGQTMIPQQVPQTQQVPQVTAQQNAQNATMPQIQNGGLIPVRSESEARSYPVAPGTSVSFKHETEPYCYTKTMGFNQFEPPRFEKFRLVKEDDEPQATQVENKGNEVAYATQEELSKVVGAVQNLNDVVGNIRSDVESMRGDMYGIAGQKKKASRKAEVADDDA